MINDTLEGRVKLSYARGKTDEQIAQQENISVQMVVDILEDSRLPIGIKITGMTIDTNPVPMLKIIRWS